MFPTSLLAGKRGLESSSKSFEIKWGRGKGWKKGFCQGVRGPLQLLAVAQTCELGAIRVFIAGFTASKTCLKTPHARGTSLLKCGAAAFIARP